MKWIKTSMQLGQAVKNVQRLRQIVGVLAKYGFADVVDRMNLGKFLPSRLAALTEAQVDMSTPVRMRRAFEELGPTFIKLGQLLSTRPDVVPESFLEELTKLQDDVQALTYDVVRGAVERELGKSIQEAYAEFNPVPLAAASIGQVHEAVLHSGEKVVVKVQRPEIERIIETDVSLLAFMAGMLEKYIPESRYYRPKVIVDEFFKSLVFELDFVIEANNMTRISHNLSGIPEVVVPKVYKALSTHKVLTIERPEGVRVNDLKAIDAAGIDRKQVVAIGARAFFKMIMMDGLFHGDLHGGNLFILPGNRLGIIDFGIVGRLSEKSREQLASMMISLITEDYDNLCYIYAEVSVSGQSIDLEAFQREVRNMISPYVGLSLQEVNAGRILIEATRIGAKYNIQVPGDWMLVFKALFTIEGMGRTLDPDFDLLTNGQTLVNDLLKKQYSPDKIKKELLWVAKDLAGLFQILPRQVRALFKKLSSNDFAIEIKSPELDAIRGQLDVNARRMSLTVLVVGFFAVGGMTLNHNTGHMIGDYPFISVVFLILGAIALMRLVWMRR